MRRQPHLGAPFQSCPDQVLAPAQVSIHSDVISIDAPVLLVLEPTGGLIAEELPPERGRVPETKPSGLPQFVQDFRYSRTWLALSVSLEDGRWAGNIEWHGADDIDPAAPEITPASEAVSVGTFEVAPSSP